jgi:hypothetical protein
LLQFNTAARVPCFNVACNTTSTFVFYVVAAIRDGVFGSFNHKHSGKSCLRDILKVTSHPELLPTAFDLSTLPGMASAAAETAAAAAAAAGKAAGSASKVASGSRQDQQQWGSSSSSGCSSSNRA